MLHARLLMVLAELGHTETLVIADAGLPIPSVVERIDLALVPSVPGFVETLRAVLGELAIESAVVAEEMAWFLVPGRRGLDDLPPHPGCRRVGRHVDMHHLEPTVSDEH